jgi:isopentenyl-diphosphate delta-isomerase type 1
MDELLDIVNDEDKIIGQEMRSAVHQLGLQHRGAHIFLFTPDGKMLVQKRSADRTTAPSALDCSVSEHVKAGESYMRAAQRGIKEELSVEEVDLKPLVKFRMQYDTHDYEICTLYTGSVDPANVKFDAGEIEEIYYFSMNELQNMLQKDKEKFCGWFVELLNWQTGRLSKMIIME